MHYRNIPGAQVRRPGAWIGMPGKSAKRLPCHQQIVRAYLHPPKLMQHMNMPGRSAERQPHHQHAHG
eukprot:scaffold291998_cov27-Tisochrysis_lutea.AAC.1